MTSQALIDLNKKRQLVSGRLNIIGHAIEKVQPILKDTKRKKLFTSTNCDRVIASEIEKVGTSNDLDEKHVVIFLEEDGN